MTPATSADGGLVRSSGCTRQCSSPRMRLVPALVLTTASKSVGLTAALLSPLFRPRGCEVEGASGRGADEP